MPKKKYKGFLTNKSYFGLKTYTILILVFIFFLFIYFISFSLFMFYLNEKPIPLKAKINKDEKLVKKLQDLLKDNYKYKLLENNLSNIIQNNNDFNKTEKNLSKILNIFDEDINKSYINEKKEELKLSKNIKINNKKLKYKHKFKDYFKKPTLVIIIDDVSFKWQVEKIKSLNLNLTMSFLPSTKKHSSSTMLANEQDFSMIHLPLEANNFSAEEEVTLSVFDDYEKIEVFMKKMRKDFPKVRYINNHTGSRFTSNYEAVKRLLKACLKYNFVLLDSKTSANSKIKIVSKELNMPYIARDVFIDNENSIAYIKNQIKLATRIAKKNGLAVVIGHPKDKTIEALKMSKDLFKGFNLINVGDLYNIVYKR